MQTLGSLMCRFAELRFRVRPTPEPRRRPWRWLGIGTAGAAVGAGLMYALDPQAGRRRRTLAGDRGAALARRSVRRSSHLAARARSEAFGRVARFQHRRRSDQPAPNDAVLADRVRSQLPRDPALHRHALNINAENGVVVLRGVVDRPEQIRALVEAVSKVSGVRRVESYLHLPNTPAPNKRVLIEIEREHAVVVPTAAAGDGARATLADA